MKEIVDYLKDVLGVEAVILNDSPLVHSKEHERVSDKLGVDSTPQILDFVGAAPQLKTQSDKIYSIFFVNLVKNSSDSLLQSENHTLFQKMFAAMKLPSESVAIAETHWHALEQREDLIQKIRDQYNLRVLVLFSAEPLRAAPRVIGELSLIESFSPALLSQKEELKRPAWEDLKMALKIIG